MSLLSTVSRRDPAISQNIFGIINITTFNVKYITYECVYNTIHIIPMRIRIDIYMQTFRELFWCFTHCLNAWFVKYIIMWTKYCMYEF